MRSPADAGGAVAVAVAGILDGLLDSMGEAGRLDIVELMEGMKTS